MKERAGMPYDVVAFSTDENALLWTLEEEGAFHRLLRHAWVNGSVPDDIAQLASICRCSVELMERMWIKLVKAWPKKGKTGRRCNPKQEQERKFLEHKRDVNKENAEKRWSNRNATAMRPHNRSQSERNAPLPIPSPSLPKEANTENNSPPPVYPPAEKRVGQDDPAADFFMLQHRELLGTAYVSAPKDFIQLARLRKANGISTRASPEGWETAVGNYFASPLTSWTLADLAVRFPAFRNSPLDRYGVPLNHAGGTNGKQPGENPNDRAAKDFLRRSLAPKV